MAKASVKTTFAIHEVTVLSGFSKHMLDYLAREDILRPSEGPFGRGNRRRYSFADVVMLRALQAICAGKGKIRHLKEALSVLRTEVGPLKPGSRVDRLLFLNGNELCLRTAAEGVRELRSGQLALAFVIDLNAVTEHVSQALTPAATGSFELRPDLASKAESERLRSWAAIRRRRAAGA